MSTRTDTRPAQVRRKPVLHLAGRDYTWSADETGPGCRTTPVLTGEVIKQADADIEAWLDRVYGTSPQHVTNEQRAPLRDVARSVQAPLTAMPERYVTGLATAVSP